LLNGETSASCLGCVLATTKLSDAPALARPDLLVFDPGKTLPSTIRTEALQSSEESQLSSASSSEYEIPIGSNAAQKRHAQEKGSKRKKLKALFSNDGSHLKLFRVKCVRDASRQYRSAS
jgi:hypothetical protein